MVTFRYLLRVYGYNTIFGIKQANIFMISSVDGWKPNGAFENVSRERRSH